jgi:hypothetical protein
MATELEGVLRPKVQDAPPFPAKYMKIANGQMMVIRQVEPDEIPLLLEYVQPMIRIERDYYDIVAARVYAELLAQYVHRIQDQYILIAQIEGELASIVNGRTLKPGIGVSLHTIALRRGLRIGAHAFAAKMEYHMDYLEHEEVMIVAESPIGFRRFLVEYNLEKRPEIIHELGGVPAYALTKKTFEAARGKLVVGRRPVPKDLLEKAKAEILPPSDPPKMPEDLLAATRSMYDPTGTALRAQRLVQEGREK